MDKIEVRKLLGQLKTHCADPATLLEQAEYAYMMSTEGYESEVPSKFGPVMVMQKNPGVAVQAVQQKLAIIKYLVDYCDRPEENQAKQELNLVINLEAITEVTP